MSVKVEVEIDPKAASAGIKVITDDLTKLEQKGPKVGKSLSEALGELGKETAAEQAIADLTAELEHEARVLATLRDPQRQYNTELATMDRLLKQDKITTAEYAKEVTRLNQELNATLPIFDEWDRKATAAANAAKAASTIGLPKHEHAEASAGSEALGEHVAALAPVALIGAGIEVLKEELTLWYARKEAITQATNQLTQFYDTFAQASAAIHEQQELAETLHVKLGEATSAYSAVRQATTDLYLTSAQQVAITKTLGEVMEMNNKPIGAAADIMGRLQFAMSQGTMEFRDLHEIAKNFPDIMDAFAKGTGKTSKQLLEMAQRGEITRKELSQFADGLITGEAAHKNYAKRVVTTTEVMDKMGVDYMEAVKIVIDSREAFEKAGISADEWAVRTVNGLKKQMDEMHKYRTGLSDIRDTLDGFSNALARLGTVLNDPFGDQAKIAQATKSALDISDPVTKAREELRKLDAGWTMLKDHTAGNAAQYRTARKALVDTISGVQSTDYYMEMLKQIQQPEKEWAGRLGALNALLKDGRINLDQYVSALTKLAKAQPLGGLAVRAQNVHSMSAGAIGNTNSLDGTLGNGGDKVNIKAFDDNEAKRAQSIAEVAKEYEKAATPLEQYKQRIQDISAIEASLDAATLKRYTEGAEHKYLVDVAEQAKKTAAAYEEFQKRHESAIQKIAQAELANGIQDLASNLVDAANGADVAWGKFVKNFIVGMEKAILKAMLLKAIGLDSSGGLTGGGLIGAISGSIGGGAYGFDSTVGYGRGAHLPGFAAGGDALVGGRGSTDSKLAVFKVTPGESVHVRTPQQRSAAEGSAGGGGPVVHNHISVDVERRALAAMDGREFDQKIINSLGRVRNAARSLLSK